MPGFPLIGRPPGAALFVAGGRTITAERFLALAHSVALPEAGEIDNLCRDPCRAALALAACLLRGRVARLGGGGTKGPALTDADIALDAVDAPAPPDPTIPGERIAAVVHTSGSTGQKVAHRKAWGALVARSLAAGSALGLDEAAPGWVVGTVPPWHMYGFETTALLPLHAACAAIGGDALYPADIADRLRAAPAPPILVTTPLQLAALLRSGLALPPLRAAISATAPLDPALAAEAGARWRTTLLEIYGATEIGSVALRAACGDPPWSPYPGLRLETGEDGAARASAPFAPATALPDQIEMLADGRFRLLGRANDLVKMGGRRASLDGLNRILNALPGVRDGAFLPPEPESEAETAGAPARMLAFVVAPGRSPRDLLAALREQIDPPFLPRRIVMLPALPRDELGKLPREALRALARPFRTGGAA